MTKRETVQLIALMQANYPDEFRNMSDEAMHAKVNLWAAMFQDDDFEQVKMAVIAHMASDTDRWMPPVGVIKQRLARMRTPDEMTEMEAWGLVKKALGNSAYNSVSEFQKLPPQIQRLVGTPAQLKEWAMMESDTLDSVVGSNFQRSYKVRVANDREYQALPASVKGFIAQLADGMAMERPRLESGDSNG